MNLLVRLSIGLVATIIVLLAIILGGIRLVLSNIEYYKPEIEYLLTEDIAPEVVFSGVSGAMNRFNPILRIENVSVNLPDRSQPLFIDSLAVEFDFWSSLREQTVVVLEVTSQLEKLELIRDQSGKWWADKYELSGGDTEDQLFDISESLALVPRYLKVDLRRLIIRDQLTETTHQLERIAAHINYQDEKFLVQVSAALPEQLGSGILMKSVVAKNHSEIYLTASDLRLNPVIGLISADIEMPIRGKLDGELWAKLEDHNLSALAGELKLESAALQSDPDKEPIALSYLSTFDAKKRDGQWQLSNRIDNLEIAGKAMRSMQTQFRLAGEADNQQLSIWIDGMDLEAVSAFAPAVLSEEMARKLNRSEVTGELRDILVSYALSSPENYLASARLDSFSSKVVDDIPGITNLNADIVASNNRIGVKLDGTAVSLDFGDLFRTPLLIDQVKADAAIQLNPFGSSIAINNIQASNPDASLNGRAWLELDQATPPFMYLRASFTDAQAENAAHYMPVKIMPEETVKWIDESIKKGVSPNGDIQFHGRLKTVADLEQEKSGEFFVDFAIEDAEVRFSPDWLAAKNGEGRVIFHNLGVDVDLTRVSYDSVDGGQATASIADFTDAYLTLDIQAQADAADAIRIWTNSPVGDRFLEPVKNFERFAGRVITDIDVNLPLDNQSEQQVEVLVNLDSGSASSEAWGLELSQIEGQISVRNENISAKAIQGLFFGDPVSINIETDTSLNQTIVSGGGEISTASLLTLFPEHWSTRVDGRSDWLVRLAIENQDVDDGATYLTMDLASNLENTKIDLPAPFGKTADASKRTDFNLIFAKGQVHFGASHNNNIRSQGKLDVSNSQDLQLSSLDFAFDTELRNENGKGMFLYGYIPSLDLDAWLDVFAQSEKGNSQLLQSIELELDQVSAFNQQLSNVDFQLEHTNEQFIGLLDSSLVRGNFQVYDDATQPVNIDLEYLRIDKNETDSETANKAVLAELIPGDLPSFKLKSQSLVFHDLLFNDLNVEARVEGDVMFIERVEMRRDEVNLTASGRWEYQAANNQHQTVVSAAVKGKQFGQAIAALGFGDSISDGVVDFTAGFNWAAPPHQVSWKNLEGDAKLRLTQGVLNNVEPGTGRYVGMLSLGALPRRLSLDFTDLLIKGMNFDEITGKYTIRNGILYTPNTRMDGPAAKIKISGKTGIESRDYDQTIRVTPKIRQTLPVLGTVAAGSTVGWGLLLLQNLFKKVIDKAVEVEYKVTGSWDDPKIELVKAVDENQTELPDSDK